MKVDAPCECDHHKAFCVQCIQKKTSPLSFSCIIIRCTPWAI